MHDGNNDDLIRISPVKYRVRKTVYETFTDTAFDYRPCLWMFTDIVDSRLDFS
ncbi:MAG: hypothetical protein BECKG1743D_GA0114223_105603 [Candidatus Kentron sp. G]|nr:MAG: hypothetical protein BECKG1743F_GA0114225_106693 [Candidatus Kentron sp. G]VFN03950.1 MAG: hypothetical protein BECKG1743E_GA0114224_106752 [Candidatus Kentron sp. G]VFN04217.1 MAG: hypothetical protein BECKG1743D_GA0114223_105603 [Candidatus Kentron sp. G]